VKRRVLFIINPVAGIKEPILHHIAETMSKSIIWDTAVTQKSIDAYDFAKAALKKRYDVIAVYGGDGTIMEVAEALFNTKTPLAIIPGGTANVLAKELGIPLTNTASLHLITKSKLKTRQIDMALVNGRPFVLRVNLGITAHMVVGASRSLKKKLGQLAYSVVALQHILRHQQFTFHLTLDGKKHELYGSALMINNAGNIGITGVGIVPNMSIYDGLLDVVFFKSLSPSTMYTWFHSFIFHKKPQSEIQHWKAKRIHVSFKPNHTVIRDDDPLDTNDLDIKVRPMSLYVVTG
jgi:diacylglycerol kinase (ATP)